jgi:uncharacterized membrane protein YqjE
MGLSKGDPAGGIAASLTQLADGLGKLITQHLKLVRIELEEDARVVGSQLARIAVFVPFVIVGYALLCVALAVGLTAFMPLWGSLAAVGGVNLVGGGIGIYVATQAIRQKKLFDDSKAALQGTRAMVQRTLSGEHPAPQLSSETPHAQ